jgi:glycosyltransferase involved in cell wall biosynthesis
MIKITFFLPDLTGGGAEKSVINLLKEFSKQPVELDLVLVNANGVFLGEVPEKVAIINLGKTRMLHAINALASYLKEKKPDVLISNLTHSNLAALIARKIAFTNTNLILVEHLVQEPVGFFSIKRFLLRSLIKKMYPSAQAVVAVSNGAARELEKMFGWKENAVTCIYNPVVEENLLQKSAEPVSHPWFDEKITPVLLSAGRFVQQKNFDTLLHAFSIAGRKRKLKLVILGDGELREDLQRQVVSLGVKEDVFMPGFVDNPYSYMKHSDVFVLSSLYEGLGNVLIEAMACGCPVVSTDCKSGPSEILGNGEFGMLVPVRNPQAMAEAILKTLDLPVSKGKLVQQANQFSAEKSAAAYWSLINDMMKDKK